MTVTHVVLRYLHISMGMLALLSGFASMAFPKGSTPHRRAGTAFFVSMMLMAGTGVYISIFITPVIPNIMGGGVTLYLTSTAWLTVWQRPGETGRLDIAAMIWGLAVAAAGFTFAALAMQTPKGMLDGFPSRFFLIFSTVAVLGALADFRMINRGGLKGSARTTRHLWRMMTAMFFATTSFFAGQAKLFSPAVRESGVLMVPIVLVIVMFFYWLIKVRVWPSVRKAWMLRGAPRTA
jgi:hypothetical protein